MAGMRLKRRGINDDGEVANFVETEQVVLYEGYELTSVLIRGSVPSYWQQTGINAGLELTRSKEMDSVAFKLHLDDMQEHYKKMLWINLLDNRKDHELKLIR